MPGPVVHTIIAEQLPGKFDAPQGSVLDAHRRELVLGAQGPDIQFFNLNDYLDEGIASKLINWWDQLGDIQYAFFKLRKPLIDIKRKLKQLGNQTVLTAAANSALVDQILSFVRKLRETSILASHIQRGFVKKAVLDNTDPFGLYVSPMQTAGLRKLGSNWEMNHDEWSWFDILHSRRTGEFAATLLDVARGKRPGFDGETRERPRLFAYAVGYLSHLAADVVGHAYVNSIVGGPYRIQQAQRHTTQEKIMDVWAYDHYFRNSGVSPDLRTLHEGSRRGQFDTRRYYLDEQLVNSGMHKNFLFTEGRLEPRQWERDPNKQFNKTPQKPITAALEAPEELSKNFQTAANETYDEDVFGTYSDDGFDISYRMWYRFFYGSTNTISPAHPSELPNQATISTPLKRNWTAFKTQHAADLLSEAYEATQAGGGSGTRGSCVQGSTPEAVGQSLIDCLEDAAESAFNFVENNAESTAKQFKQAAQLAAAVGKGIRNSSIPLNAQLTNFSLQKLYEKLFAAYKDLLMQVTAVGFSYMYTEDLHTGPLEHLWNPVETDGLGVNSPRNSIVKPGSAESGFPRPGMRMADSRTASVLDGLQNDSHLLVPTTPVEQPTTIPGPDLYGTEEPHVFIDDHKNLTPGAVTGGTPPLGNWVPTPSQNSSNPGGRVPQLSDYRAGTSGGQRGRYAEPILGNAVDFTLHLYNQYTETGEVPNLNMSGDRAIGYPTWASQAGYDRIPRDRWQVMHGKRVPWLKQPIEPVFVPKLLPEDSNVTPGPGNPGNSYY